MISVSAAMHLVLLLVVVGVVFGLLWWLVDYCALPEPFGKVARVVLAILAVFLVIGLLLQLVGGQQVFTP